MIVKPTSPVLIRPLNLKLSFYPSLDFRGPNLINQGLRFKSYELEWTKDLFYVGPLLVWLLNCFSVFFSLIPPESNFVLVFFLSLSKFTIRMSICQLVVHFSRFLEKWRPHYDSTKCFLTFISLEWYCFVKVINTQCRKTRNSLSLKKNFVKSTI